MARGTMIGGSGQLWEMGYEWVEYGREGVGDEREGVGDGRERVKDGRDQNEVEGVGEESLRN